MRAVAERGAYLCNQMMYLALDWAARRRGPRAGFVHLPSLPTQSTSPPAGPTMDLDPTPGRDAVLRWLGGLPTPTPPSVNRPSHAHHPGHSTNDALSPRAGGAPRVVVVGGGLAGMAAAASDAGCHVTLLGARRSLGGRAGSFEDPQTGEVLDNCQHVPLGCCTNLRDFYRRIGPGRHIRFDRAITFFDDGPGESGCPARPGCRRRCTSGCRCSASRC